MMALLVYLLLITALFIIPIAKSYATLPPGLAKVNEKNIVKSVESIAVLRQVNINIIGNTPLEVLGYYKAGDGGGGKFNWDNSSISNDNGGTIVKPDAIASNKPGRWLRNFSNKTPVMFGAVGDGTKDDTAALKNLSDSLVDGETVLFPAKLVFKVSWCGANGNLSLSSVPNNLSSSPSGKALFNLTKLSNLRIEGNGSKLYQESTFDSTRKGVPYVFFYIGDGADNVTISGFEIDGNREHEYSYMTGFLVGESNKVNINNNKTVNTKFGIAFLGGATEFVVNENRFNYKRGKHKKLNAAPENQMLSNDFGIYAPDAANLDGEIIQNYFGPSNRDGIEIDYEGISALWGGKGAVAKSSRCRRIIIENNKFSDILAIQEVPGSYGLAIGLANICNARIANNHIQNTTIGIHLEAQKLKELGDSAPDYGTENCNIYANTIDSTDQAIRLVGTKSISRQVDTRNILISNNIITRSREGIKTDYKCHNVTIKENYIDMKGKEFSNSTTGIFMREMYMNKVLDNVIIGYDICIYASNHDGKIDSNSIQKCKIAFKQYYNN